MRISTRAARTARRRLLGAAVAITALALAGCAPDPGGGGGGSTNLATCPTAAAGQVRVAVVVDATAFGAVSVPSVVCVVVSQGASGIAALNARAVRTGLPAPRFNASGLLCAIDGAPVAPACGQVGPNGYEYWSYWSGGASWQYAASGPASRQMQDGSVEGWRFTTGGTNQPPAAPSSFAALVS